MKLIWVKITVVFFACFCSYWMHPFSLEVAQSELDLIAKKIWQNECGGKVDKLLFWNEAEDFPSCGIGHFIWMPRQHKRQFAETFPEFIRFCRKNDIPYPSWLISKQGVIPCPWPDRAAFMKDQSSQRYKSLKKFLETSMTAQAEFIILRFERSMLHMLDRLPEKKSGRVQEQIKRLAMSPGGLYALVDYINFKGSGASTDERYNNFGWGLLHVVEGMKGREQGDSALKEFVANAKLVLTRRVNNAPPTKDERRFLPGWYNRLDTYLKT